MIKTNNLKNSRDKVEIYFYYVNEMVALYASTIFLSFFMVVENKEHRENARRIYESFPMAPTTKNNKKGFWNSVVFNLNQINDEKQIGIDHYDLYSYAMFYYWLEKDFNDNMLE